MDEDLRKKILNIYPEYDRITGPSVAKDGRARVGLRNTLTGAKTVRQFAKVKLEAQLGRKLSCNETVDHKNSNKTDDRDKNLQLLSRSENARKGSLGNKYCLGKKQSEEQKRNGEKNGMALLTNKEAKELREAFHNNTLSRVEIQIKTNLTDRSVRNLLKGISYTQASGPILTHLPRGRPNNSATVAKLVETQRT